MFACCLPSVFLKVNVVESSGFRVLGKESTPQTHL